MTAVEQLGVAFDRAGVGLGAAQANLYHGLKGAIARGVPDLEELVLELAGGAPLLIEDSEIRSALRDTVGESLLVDPNDAAFPREPISAAEVSSFAEGLWTFECDVQDLAHAVASKPELQAKFGAVVAESAARTRGVTASTMELIVRFFMAAARAKLQLTENAYSTATAATAPVTIADLVGLRAAIDEPLSAATAAIKDLLSAVRLLRTDPRDGIDALRAAVETGAANVEAALLAASQKLGESDDHIRAVARGVLHLVQVSSSAGNNGGSRG